MELSFFAEMAWKSALISGAALAFAMLLRSRAAADRAMVLRIGVAMLLALPLIVLFLPALEIVAFAAPAAPALPSAAYAGLSLADLGTLPPAAEPTIWDDPTPLIVLAYLGGLVMVGGRLVAGLFMLHRWTRAARDVTCPEWQAALDRVRWSAGDPESIRLMVSDLVKSPLSWGWLRPVILIDPDTLDEPEDAEAILAHEVAHIARRDWLSLMLARVAATLFWFNPLVWLLEREIVQQAEEAADLEAAQRVDPARYAETLLSWARFNGMVPANSIAPTSSALGRRVRAVLDRSTRERPTGSVWTRIAMLLCLGIAAPVAAAKLVAAAQDPAAVPEAPAAPAAPSAPSAPDPVAPPAPPAPPAPLDIELPAIPEVPDMTPAIEGALAVLPQVPRIVASATASVEPSLRLAQVEMRRAGRSHAEIDEAMREARREITRAQAEARRTRDREVAEAMREARREIAQAHRVRRVEVAAAMREAQRAIAAVPRTVAVSMASAATGMERGAAGMERGADQMERTAHRLESDPAYREEQIRRAREQGETVTHEQLIDAADDMRDGAEGMREGAREMRESAARMRRGES
ncbi:M56 family metallopeptidase [Sphingosinicella sp. LHD-64]|uniref:M56 family metallopeptidase n=1 Tax=Sphingosinicella sp. LHD-64 TaxID=3072139 RepID=UPI0028105495|nr:M56 family metallopeptidase [Sphingosinicella sp. LHD-64]MDQ8755987.1 M56 family metallopeptidase [Sphingosinicella sp. LHD-64]